jgi:hypothetical protein
MFYQGISFLMDPALQLPKLINEDSNEDMCKKKMIIKQDYRCINVFLLTTL